MEVLEAGTIRAKAVTDGALRDVRAALALDR
jgi:hypothetical protein